MVSMHQNICLSCRVGHFHSFLPKADQNSVHFKSKPDNNSIMKLKRYTKKQVIDFAKKNVATSDYAFGERSGQYIVTVPKKKK